MTWMPEFLRKHSDVDYTGYDLIPQNIQKNKESFKNESWTFKQFDMIKTRIGIAIISLSNYNLFHF